MLCYTVTILTYIACAQGNAAPQHCSHSAMLLIVHPKQKDLISKGTPSWYTTMRAHLTLLQAPAAAARMMSVQSGRHCACAR